MVKLISNSKAICEASHLMSEIQSINSDPSLQDVIKRLVDAYHPNKIYLFGSRARGSADSGSDYDLLLVVPENADRKLKTAGRAYEALWGIKVPVDVVVWTNSEFNKRLHLDNSLPAVVMREGTLLHAA